MKHAMRHMTDYAVYALVSVAVAAAIWALHDGRPGGPAAIEREARKPNRSHPEQRGESLESWLMRHDASDAAE